MSCQSLAAARAFGGTVDLPPVPAEADPVLPCGAFHRSVRFSSDSSRHSSSDVERRRDGPGSISLTALPVPSPSPSPSPSPNPIPCLRSSIRSQPIVSMSQSAPSASSAFPDIPAPAISSCRFPKLEECAHFHYERVSLGGLRVELMRKGMEDEDDEISGSVCGDEEDIGEGWVTLRVRSHVNDPSTLQPTNHERDGPDLNISWANQAAGGGDMDSCGQWMLTRSAENFKMLDNMLHRCIYDRKVSGLSDLSAELTHSVIEERLEYESLISDYLHHFSIIADDTINCGPVLNWLQMDNKGYRLLVANEDSSSINTPAVAAAYSVRRYVSQARDEISFEVGDMISIIDMPGPQESVWWRGKRGFRVGFFPHHCVAVIGDKVPRHMTQPPPIVGSVAVAPMKPVLRKHGKLISLFRSFILARPSRRALKQQGILRERVFACDLGEHLLNSGHEVPLILCECAHVIEAKGVVDGIYRLSGASSLTQRLRLAFDEGGAPDLGDPAVAQDVHAVASLLKMYFRELPNPLCTYQLYEAFVGAVARDKPDAVKLSDMRAAVLKLPPPHYRTLSYLMRHLRLMSIYGPATGMTARNMAIVWAPNLLRSPRPQHALHGVAIQAVVTEFLICYAEELFSEEQPTPDVSSEVEVRHPTPQPDTSMCRRPKSLPIPTPSKLLSLEEAQSRGGATSAVQVAGAPIVPPHASTTTHRPAPQAPLASLAPHTDLRPTNNREPKYIEVGSGPNNLPQYHTVIELPGQGGAKRGLKRSPSGWRGLFFRSSKHHRPPPSTTTTIALDTSLSMDRGPQSLVSDRTQAHSCSALRTAFDNELAIRLGVGELTADKRTKDLVSSGSGSLRPVKSCESLQSESDPLAPLGVNAIHSLQASKQHSRSASCDSYFEPWQAELAGMRLRLSPQERDGNLFSEEDDTTVTAANGNGNVGAGLQTWQAPTVSSSPVTSEICVEAANEVSPSRSHLPIQHEAVDRKRSKMEEQLSDIKYIDCNTPEHTVSQLNTKECIIESQPQILTLDFELVELRQTKGKASPEKRSSEGAILPSLGETVVGEAKRVCKDRDKTPNSTINEGYTTSVNVKMRERSSPRKVRSSNRYSGMHHPVQGLPETPKPSETKIVTIVNNISQPTDRLSWHGSQRRNPDTHSTLIKIDWPDDSNVAHSLTANTINSSFQNSPVTPNYDPLDSDSEISDNRQTIKIDSGLKNTCSSCENAKKCLKCELLECAINQTKTNMYENLDTDLLRPNVAFSSFVTQTDSLVNTRDSLDISPGDSSGTNVSYQNLNRLSNISTSSNSKSETMNAYENVGIPSLTSFNSILTDSMTDKQTNDSSSYSNVSPVIEKCVGNDELYEGFNFSRPNYINLASTTSFTSSENLSKSTSPIRSTISITYKSPTKTIVTENATNVSNDDYEPVNPLEMTDLEIRDSVYEDVDLNKSLSIIEEASIPVSEACLPTQEASQPNLFTNDLILLESPSETIKNNGSMKNSEFDVYNTVKMFRKSVEEVNAMFLETDVPNETNKTDADEGTYEIFSFTNAQDITESKKTKHEETMTEISMTKSDSGILRIEERHIFNVNGKPEEILENVGKDVSENDEKMYVDDLFESFKASNLENDKMETQQLMNRSSLSLNMDVIIENGNFSCNNTNLRKNSNVRELAHKFESPTEAKSAFNFENKSSLRCHDVKYQSLERAGKSGDRAKSFCESKGSKTLKIPPPVSPKTYKLSRASTNARSLDESAFAKEFGCGISRKIINTSDRRKSMEVREIRVSQARYVPDLNLNNGSEMNEMSEQKMSTTPTTENRISLVQARFQEKTNEGDTWEEPKSLDCTKLNLESKDSKLSRERIERYKEERRNFLREKYSSQSFRSPTGSASDLPNRLKIRKPDDIQLRNPEKYEHLFANEISENDEHKFERRNTVDLGQRTRFTLARDSGDLVSEKIVKTGEISKDSEKTKVSEIQRKFSTSSITGDRKSSSIPVVSAIRKVSVTTSKDLKPEVADRLIPTSLNLEVRNSEIGDTCSDAAKVDVVKSSDDRRDKRSPSFNIKDMAAMFEQRSHNH